MYNRKRLISAAYKVSEMGAFVGIASDHNSVEPGSFVKTKAMATKRRFEKNEENK